MSPFRIHFSNVWKCKSILLVFLASVVDGGRMENVGCPTFTRLGNRASTFGNKVKKPVGIAKNIRISDITATVILQDRDQSGDYSEREKGKAGPIMISYPGYAAEKEANNIVSEDETRYPE